MEIIFPVIPDKYTVTEQKIIEFMVGHRNEFLYMPIGKLAETLNVSEATVSRFSRHVGCNDFKHLKRIVMEQTMENGPARKLTNTLISGNGELLRHCLEQQQENLQKTLEFFDLEAFDRAVQAVKHARRVYIHAKNASQSMAELMEFRLRRLGLDVHRIPSGGMEVIEGLVSVEKEDVVLVFGFSKTSAEGKVVLEHSCQVGAVTVLFTSRLCPEDGPQPDVRLYVCRGEENAYHSMSAPAAVIDAMVVALSAEMGQRTMEKLDYLQHLKETFREKL